MKHGIPFTICQILPGHKSTRTGVGYWDGEGEIESQSHAAVDAQLEIAEAGS